MKKHFRRTIMLSWWAYMDPDKIKEKLRAAGFRNFCWIESVETDTQCFICMMGEFVYLVFRGSSTNADWVTNLDFAFVPCQWGQMHKGFHDDAESVYMRVVGELPRHIIRGRRLIITGHSQGAGVACVTAIKLLEDHRDVFAVIHYGGPRVADFTLAGYLQDNHSDLFHRFVNNNDVVTRVPPRLFGYRHFGHLHYFFGDGSYTTDVSAWRMFLDRLRYKIDFGGEHRVDIFNDHMQGAYADCVFNSFPVA